MKKHNLLKVIGISFFVVVLLSWIIPVGSISNGTYTAGSTEPIGLIGLFRAPIMTIQTFIQYAIVILAIGAFYGVLNKLGCYDAVVEKIAKRHSKKPVVFLIISMLFFAILTSLSGSTMYLFAFVPFFAAIILSLGYNNVTALATTVGAILVGQIGSIYGFSIVGYNINILGTTINSMVFVRILLFAITTFLFVFLMVKNSKRTLLAQAKEDIKEGIEKVTKKVKESTKNTKTAKSSAKKTTVKKVETKTVTKAETKKQDILFLDNSTTKKNIVPFIVIIVLFAIVGFIGLYNWYYSFQVSAFSNFDTFLKDIKIGGFSIVSSILGNSSVLGFWGNYELAILLIIASAVLGWVYNVKIDDYIDGIWTGMKKMALVALYATLASIVFYVMIAGDNGNIYNTIVNYIGGLGKTFNLWTSSLLALVGSLLNNDYYYVISSAASVFGTYDATVLPLVSILCGGIYGVVMLVAPVSVLLVAGLKYFEVSYKDWMKYIWKYALMALAIVLFIVTITYAFI